MGVWLQTPPGRHLVAWEQRCLDEAVVNVFGFHALQLGLPELDALRANRMPSRWLAHEEAPPSCRGGGSGVMDPAALAPEEAAAAMILPRCIALHCLPEALPFASESLDLVVLPHTLEQATDAHQALAEVIRVLRPEGRVVLSGFNPLSLWGMRHRVGRWQARCTDEAQPNYLPPNGELITPWRLRDWLRLLSCQVEAEWHGCYVPPLNTTRWLERWGWMERLGSRWWKPLGAAYVLVAVKRVRGVRLIGVARSARKAAQGVAVAASRRSL